MYRLPTDDERTEIEGYLLLPQDDLKLLISIFDKEKLQLINNNDNSLTTLNLARKYLCMEWDLCQKVTDPYFSDPTNLILAIGDAIIGSGLPIIAPPFLLATMIVKISVSVFCQCYEDKT